MVRAIFPGSFDPLTNGHIETLRTAAKIFEEVYLVVMTNTNKDYLFSEAERFNLAKQVLINEKKITVISRPQELTVNVAHKLKATVIVRGVRNNQDFSYESEIATINKSIAPDLNTILLLTSPEYSFISSSMIKETVTFGGKVDNLVPNCVARALSEKLEK